MKFINITERAINTVQLKELDTIVDKVIVSMLPNDLYNTWCNMSSVRDDNEVRRANKRLLDYVLATNNDYHDEIAVLLDGDLSACIDLATSLVKNNIKILIPVTKTRTIRSEWKPEYEKLYGTRESADVIIKTHVMYRKLLF